MGLKRLICDALDCSARLGYFNCLKVFEYFQLFEMQIFAQRGIYLECGNIGDYFVAQRWVSYLFLPAYYPLIITPPGALPYQGTIDLAYLTVNANTPPLVKFVSWYCFL